MTLSKPFIRRPVATLLVAIGILLLGALSYFNLPIAALPNVDRPTISVWGYLPGASADTVATSLAQPLERQLGTIPGIVEMFAYSGAGGCEIDIQFDLDKDVDAAATAVQSAINAAGPNLPKDLPLPPGYWKANPSGAAVIVLAMMSDVLTPSEVYEAADSVVGEKLSQLPGVARVNIAGAERGAVRIRASPRQMANLGVSLEQVRQTVQNASLNLPKGVVEDGDQQWTLEANDQLLKAEDYRDLVVAWRNNAAVHLRDIATVTDSVINSKLAGWYNDRRAVVIQVYKQPDANVVETVDAVKAALPGLARWLPPSVRMVPVYDRTTLIRASIADVQMTIAIAIGLVVLVVLLFLRRVWATLIPALAIPVALAATAVTMRLLGYTLDNLSLMAMAVAIGFVVDDAVIVVENVISRMDAGQNAAAAALGSARQMGFTIVAISAALVAALTPVLFMPDVVGRYMREFGVTLAVTIVFSALVSLTLTPMLCSRLLAHARPHAERRSLALVAYTRSLDWSLRHPLAIVLAVMLTIAATGGLYVALPKGFMPTEDTGILRVRTVTIANVSFGAMEQLQRSVAQAILADRAVSGLTSYIGADNGTTLSSGNLYVALKPLDKRREPIEQVVARLRTELAKVTGVRTFFIPLQDLNLGAQSSSARYQYTLTAANPDELLRWETAMRRRMYRMPEITDIISNVETTGLEAGLAINRTRAAAMGVTPMAIDSTLYDAFGQRQIRTMYLPSNYSRVILEVDPAAGSDPAAFANIYVPGAGGAQVPLAAVTRPFRSHAAMWVVHADQFPSATISFDTKPGISIGDAITAIRTAERELHLPDEVQAGFKGEALEASKSGGTQLAQFVGAVIAVYIVLGILYESFAHPFTILSTLPSALFGAMLALRITGFQFTLITSIACILLVGMVMKNAIMMVDFALELQRARALSPRDAVRQAALQRARPIIMTTLVAILSAIPLAIGTGPGHELRQPLGIAMVGGLVASQILTLYSTPVIFLLIARLGLRRGAHKADFRSVPS
ncbi:efflux RND transporter permease subunit [Acidisphaera sp. L21]|uniref:efflux RND transporter permease subunit n=1 Tax=Acidisphaera sp. L21 TaxID=1641851 RepID=UPI00131ABE36|nr:efflux RND transporter permease subunit [Acidisphaera sp. L21]